MYNDHTTHENIQLITQHKELKHNSDSNVVTTSQ